MIEEQFGLSSAPFRLGTDARFYYESEAHRRAMAHLRYGLRLAEGFVVITGEAGVGKTMLVERLLLDLEGSDVIAAAIQPAGLTAENLPRRVLAAFGREAGEEDPTSALQDVLVMERARGAKASLIIDEAQHLSDEVLEALRLLLNLSDEGESLLQVCLLGQTGLRRVLFRPDMEQFRQRVIASHHLPALGVADTEAYIRHRMRRAGRAEGDELFTEGACVAVFEATGGVPRRINLLCGQALMQAALDGADAVDAETVRAVHAESQSAGPDELGPAPERAAQAEAPQPITTVSAEPTPLPANDDEEAAAERALALVTARTEGVAGPSEPEEPEDEPEGGPEAEEIVAAGDADDVAPAEEASEDAAASAEPTALRYAGQVNGGAAAGRYPVSVGEINAAIQSIQAPAGPANRPATRPANGTPNRRPNGAAGGPIGARDAGRPRRVRSPHELMLRKSQDAGEVGEGSVTGEAARADTPVLTLSDAPGSDAPAEPQAPVDRAALDAFLDEIGPALAELRAALAALRERTDRLDEARRARRERLADEADEAAARLAKLRGE